MVCSTRPSSCCRRNPTRSWACAIAPSWAFSSAAGCGGPSGKPHLEHLQQREAAPAASLRTGPGYSCNCSSVQSSTDRFGRQRGQLAGEIRIEKRPMANAQTFQSAENSPESSLGLDATEDEMRMLVASGNERACHFNARMAGLNGLLRRG